MADEIVKKRTRIKINKPEEVIIEEGILSEDEDNVQDIKEEVARIENAPIPAPRKIREENLPPEPLPRRSLVAEDEIKVSDKTRKKKKKAAEVIANVLRKESRKQPQIATISEDNEEKDVDDGGVGSPWDSPPPPQSLQKVYIQNKYGFSVRDWCDFYKSNDENFTNPRNRCAVDVALAFHKIWSRLSVFSHGVVAGIAGCHALAVGAALAATQNHVPDFVQFYHFLSLKIHFAVYVFTTLCIVSCLDRLDIGQFSKDHLRAIGRSHGTLLLTIGYIACLVLSLAAHRHTAAIEAYSKDNTLWNAQGLYEWTCLTTTRDILLLFCWIFMSCSRPTDLLQEKLNEMTTAENLGKAGVWID